MFRPRWFRNVLDIARSHKDCRRLTTRSQKPVRLTLEKLEDRITPSGFQTLYSFTGGSDGQNPKGGVIADDNGNLYGTTALGGQGRGTLFEISSKGTSFTNLYSFTAASGNNPQDAPIRDGSGNLFGTTYVSGTGEGTVFEYSAKGTYTTLHTFALGTDGASPIAGLIMDNKGDLFGTTTIDSSNGGGSVFELSANGSGGYNFTTLYSFGTGFQIYSGLVMDNAGKLYGTTLTGGASNAGVVYKLSPDGSGGYTYSTLHTFMGSDGGSPIGGLTLDGKGHLYGTTSAGGAGGTGSVFQLSTDGSSFTTLYSFGSNGAGGANPQDTLLLDSKGNLYGTTYNGGTSNDGVVFKLSPNENGSYTNTTLHTFVGSDGANPYAGLVTDGNGNLYGTTINGGTNSDGTIFEITGVLPASTRITADDVSVPFSTNTQNVTLTANVTSSSATVNEGTVTFTILQGSTVIGSATTSATVSNGAASVSYALPAGTAIGTYTIDAEYNPGPDFTTSSDTTHTLTITGASTTIAANNATAKFSESAQNATLTADVTSSAGPVNEGTVTFTVKQGATVIGTTTTSGTVSGGAASVSYALPAGTAAGNYTIDAVYNPGSEFTTSTDDTHTLTVSTASTTTASSNASAVFSTNAQNVTLSADVTSSAGAVNEGTVTFTVLKGSTVIGTATTSGTVGNGAASVSFALPGGTAAGSYVIDAVYNPGSDFVTSSDDTRTLTVTPADVTTTAVNASAIYSASSQTVTLSATVADTSIPGDTVGEGTVIFTVKNGSADIGTSVQGTVKGGKASADFNLPAGQAAGSYTITVSYGDSPVNFTDNGDKSATLTVLLAPTVTTNPANVTVTVGQTATFTAAANSNPAPTVKWQASGDGGSTWTDISGATMTTLTLGNVLSSLDGDEYRAVFSNSAGTVTTTAALLIVQTPPAITSGTSAIFTAGQVGSFTVTAAGSPTPTLTESGALPAGVTFTGGGNGMATLGGAPAVGTQGTYHFTLTAHNGVGGDATQSFTLTVNPAPVPSSPPPSPSPSPSAPVSGSQPPTLNVPPLLALFDSMLGAVETINANNTETVTDSLFGITLIASTYDGSGNFMSATLFGVIVPNWVWSL